MILVNCSFLTLNSSNKSISPKRLIYLEKKREYSFFESSEKCMSINIKKSNVKIFIHI